MRAYVIDKIDLKELCANWEDKGTDYELEDVFFDEFISIRKNDRMITNHGYMGLLSEWDRSGIISFK